MKKHPIISFLVLLTISIGCNNTNEFKNDLERLNLKGKVKTLKWTPYEAVEKFGEVTKGEIAIGENYSIVFNEEGNMIERKKYLSSGKPYEKYVYKYDSNHNLIEENYSSYGEFESKTKYKYDDRGKRIEKAEYNSEGSLSGKEVYKYDEKGNKIEIQNIASNGDKYGKGIFKYNKKNKLVEKNYYRSDGNLIKKGIFIYNENGDLIEEKDSDKNFNMEVVAEYKDKGIKIISHDSDDNINLQTKVVFNSNFFRKMALKYKDILSMFDVVDDLDVAEGKVYDSKNDSLMTAVKYTYDYDMKGNWTKRIEYQNEKLKGLVGREITYYE